MCGRYRLSRRKQEIEDYFEAESDVAWEPRYNIAPTQPVAIIRQNAKRREFSLARWGLIPRWAKDASIGQSTINARAESVLEKPSFAEAFRQQRCLIPADGFYEWQRAGKSKQPFHFGMSDGSMFAFAGLWDEWTDPGGHAIESCSILTITANALMSEVHHRMPVILARDTYTAWLDPAVRDTEYLAALLKPFNPALMKCNPVSDRVNAVANDDAECAAPRTLAQPALPFGT
jgi:putative SOS response-associated peptidase YedK